MIRRVFVNRSQVAAAFLSLFAILTANPAMGQVLDKSARVPETAPTPIYFGGNPTCATVNASTDPALAHVTENWGLKLNFQPVEGPNGPYTYENLGLVLLQGGAPAEPANSVSVTRTGSTIAWSSTRPVTAVIVKGASEANVYPYSPGSYGGSGTASGLQTPTGTNLIGHLIFCYENFVSPTEAPVSVMGRVIDLGGRGVSGVSVIATNEQTGEVTIATSSSFGYYRLDQLTIGTLYTVRVESKRFQFFDAERTLVLDDDVQGLDFVRIR